MEEEMFDTHLCLVCNQTIVGLINYVVHKKDQCCGGSGKKPTPQLHPPGQQQTYPAQIHDSDLTNSHLTDTVLLNQPQNDAKRSMLMTDIGQQNKDYQSLLYPQQPDVSKRSSTLSDLGERTKEFAPLLYPSDSFTQSLQTLSEATFTSTPATVSLPTVSDSGHFTGFDSSLTTQADRLFHTSHLNSGLNPITSLSQIPSTLPPGDHPLSSTLAGNPPQCLSTSAHPSLSPPNLSFSPPSNHRSALPFSPPSSQPSNHLSFSPSSSQARNALSVEVQQSLTHFINANLSPVTGTAVDPNSVIPTTESGHCEDFFQSLELQSKGAKDQKSPMGYGKDILNHQSRPFDDDHTDIDLPISKILSNLDFSSDEDIVDFPSEDDLDPNFDVYSDEELDVPPNTHTGGKWKPGETPQHKTGGKKIKWRLGAGPIRHGGKWKPESHGKNISSKGKQAHVSTGKHSSVSQGKITPTSPGKLIPTSPEKQIPIFPGKYVSIGKQESLSQESPEEKQDQPDESPEKTYECVVCDMTFDNRFLYSSHYGSKGHKVAVAAQEDATELDVPPHSHTGGKWKPGETPQHKTGGKKIKWRLGESVSQESPEEKQDQPEDSPEKSYECVVCDMTFDNRFLFSSHYGSKGHRATVAAQEEAIEKARAETLTLGRKGTRNSPRNKQKHECTVCDKKFQRKYEVAKHLVTNFHRNRAMEHPEAINMFQKYYNLVLRFSPYQCKICKFYCNREADFIEHMDTLGHLDNCNNALGQLECVVCKYIGHTAQELTDHLKSSDHQQEVRKGPVLVIVKEHLSELKCEYCGLTMSSRKRLARHVEYRHPQKKKSNPYVRLKGGHHPECYECGKVCISPSALVVHVRRNHTRERPFKCVPCGKSFIVQGALATHLKSQRHEAKSKQKAALDILDEAITRTLDTGTALRPNTEMKDQPESPEKAEAKMSGVVDNHDSKISDEDYIDDDHDDMIENDDVTDTVKKPPRKKTKRKARPTFHKIKKGKVYKCEHCEFVTSTYDELKPHCESVHPKEIRNCKLCVSTFMSQKAYRIHCSGRYHQEQMDNNNDDVATNIFKCSVCKMKFTDEKWRDFHCEYQHKHLNSEASVKEINKGNDQVTKLYGEHLQLLEDLPKSASLSCPECGKFLKKDHLVEHLRLHTGEKPYKCRLCDKSFVAKLSLRRHLMMHMGLTENTCNICGRDFKKVETYRLHMQQHSGEREGNKCICDVCGMTFTLQKQVENHMKRHGERKHVCPYEGCTWTFVMKNELRMHMLTHTKEKKFLCDICGFAATTKNRLQRHVKTHSGVRDYHCMYCTYKAGCSTHLRRHMRIHVGSKPFKCPYCPYTCNTHENVRKHIAKTKKHQGLKVYPCKFCEYGTNVGKDFRDHLIRNHPNEINGVKLDSLSVISGLYIRDEDHQEPQEGTQIVQVKERPPKLQKNALVNLKSQTIDMQAASTVLTEAANQVVRPTNQICNIEAYWSNNPNANRHWYPSDSAATLSSLTSDQGQLYAHPVSTSENCFLVNVGHGNTMTNTVSFHEGSVANVVVVGTDDYKM